MCLFWCVVGIQPVDDLLVSGPLDIHCSVNTADIINSDDVTISWTGPNGTITNDTRLTIIPTVSSGTNHFGTLQFSYLSEDDEGSYECSTTVLSYNKSKTAPIELTNFISELTLCKFVCMSKIKTHGNVYVCMCRPVGKGF